MSGSGEPRSQHLGDILSHALQARSESLLAPPFIVTERRIDEIVDRLGAAVDDALT
jgi:adenosylmethionine-8-amino-7-oxononanoate aminotransferase